MKKDAEKNRGPAPIASTGRKKGNGKSQFHSGGEVPINRGQFESNHFGREGAGVIAAGREKVTRVPYLRRLLQGKGGLPSR